MDCLYEALQRWPTFGKPAAGVRDTCVSKFSIKHMVLHYFPTTLQLNNLPVDCAGELFKCSKDLASIPDGNENILESFGFFCG